MAERTKTETPVFSDSQLDEMAKKAGKKVNEEQDKVKIRIPVEKLNPTDLMVPVTINGYTWTIKRGEYVEVPEEVVNILSEAGYI